MKLANIPVSQNVVDLRRGMQDLPPLETSYVTTYSFGQFATDAVSVFAMLSGIAAIVFLLVYIAAFLGKELTRE